MAWCIDGKIITLTKMLAEIMENKIQLFEDRRIRYAWDAEKDEWYFSILDVVEALTDSADPKQYIKKMRARDESLNSNWGTICTPVQMRGLDGKSRRIQALDAQGILRIIQSISSPKAEPFKMWLAQVGSERLDEIADPEKAIMRGAEYYRAKGYPEGWINQRLQTIEMRKELTDEWKARGITKEKEYAILTNDMTRAWSGMSVQEYKQVKGLTKESLRDNMTNMELLLNALAEESATQLSKERNPEGLIQNAVVSEEGAEVAKTAKDDFEKRLGRSVVTSEKAIDYIQSPEELPFNNR